MSEVVILARGWMVNSAFCIERVLFRRESSLCGRVKQETVNTHVGMGSSRLITVGRGRDVDGAADGFGLGGSSSTTYWCRSPKFSRCRNLVVSLKHNRHMRLAS